MPGPPRRPANPVSDIERFLMEVERLRRKTAEEKRRSGSEDVDEVEVVGPAPAPPPVRRPARPRPRRAEPQVLEVLPAPPPRPAPAQAPAPSPSPYDQPKQQAQPPKEERIAQTAVVGAVRAAGQGSKPGTQSLRDVVSLLRSGQIQTGIILSEVLGPPLSLRRRRH